MISCLLKNQPIGGRTQNRRCEEMMHLGKLAACVLGLTLVEKTFATKSIDEIHRENIDVIAVLLQADKLLVCPVVCSKTLCKAEAFQKFCKSECEPVVKDETYRECLAQKLISIPPLRLVTETIKGAERGALLGGLVSGGSVSAVTSPLIEEGSTPLSVVGSVPGAVVGAVPGTAIGLVAGAGYAAFESALIGFCQGFCSQKMCQKPKIKSLCKNVCSGGREIFIKNCSAAEPPQKPIPELTTEPSHKPTPTAPPTPTRQYLSK
jgi:hypothetical protein